MDGGTDKHLTVKSSGCGIQTDAGLSSPRLQIVGSQGWVPFYLPWDPFISMYISASSLGDFILSPYYVTHSSQAFI